MPSTPHPAHTLQSWTAPSLRWAPGALAVVDRGGRTWTRAEVEAEVQRWERLLRQTGVRPGDRVATLTHNRTEHLALLLACARRRLVLVPLSRRLTAGELSAQLAHAEPLVLVSEAATAELAITALDGSRLELAHLSFDLPPDPPDPAPLTTVAGDPGLGIREPPATVGGEAHEEVGEEDPLLMLFTAGTTGRPKAAVLSQRACWWTNAALAGEVDLSEHDVVLSVLPQFHVAGWNIFPLLALRRGAVLVQERDFDAARALALIARHRVTTLMGVPATYRLMAATAGFADRDLSSLRHVVVGGAPCPPELVRAWAERGVRLRRGYGLTEAGPNVLCEPASPPAETTGEGAAGGRPYPQVEVALAEPGTGARSTAATAPGRVATGELLVRGPGVFSGYWRDPAETSRALRDGWLHTGDLAERDADGSYRILGRLDDLFVSGGENVQPAEVEQVLRAHPHVADAAVVGVPDERWGQVGLAVVVPRPGAAVSPDELLDHVRTRLAGFKVPRHVRVVGSLPQSPMNKVLRTRIRQSFLAEDTRHDEGARHDEEAHR